MKFLWPFRYHHPAVTVTTIEVWTFEVWTIEGQIGPYKLWFFKILYSSHDHYGMLWRTTSKKNQAWQKNVPNFQQGNSYGPLPVIRCYKYWNNPIYRMYNPIEKKQL